MNHTEISKRAWIIGTLALALAVLIGAFGAHGLKNIVSPEKLIIFETGVRYQFYHGFGILFLAIFSQFHAQARPTFALHAFWIGILLFSVNCYFYVLTDIKVFAMLVPLGGLLFILGWLHFAWTVSKLR